MYLEFPLWLIGLRTRLVFMRMWLRSLTSLSGLRIRCHYKLWQRSWMELRSGVAVVKAGSCSSYLTLVWEFPHATSVALKRKKKKAQIFLPYHSGVQKSRCCGLLEVSEENSSSGLFYHLVPPVFLGWWPLAPSSKGITPASASVIIWPPPLTLTASHTPLRRIL